MLWSLFYPPVFLQAARDKLTGTLAVMVASDVFLNPKHAGSLKVAVPNMMNYLAAKLGVMQADINFFSPKLGGRISEVMGGSTCGSDSSRKRSNNASVPQDDSKPPKKAKGGNASGGRKRQQGDQ